jgi:hypothetical protein
VGASPVVVTALGRLTASGNTQVHTVKLVDITALNVVASADVATSGQPAGQFAYENLISPVMLPAGGRYYLLSHEFGGGDYALKFPSNVVTTTVATMDGRAWQDSGGAYYFDGGGQNMEYEAVDFMYQVGTPTGVTFNPNAPSLPDNAAAGTTAAVVSVTMSDGSQFSGTLSASPPSLFGISGSNLVISRALSSADDGPHACSVTASQNSGSATGNVTVQVGSAPGQAQGTGFPYWDQTGSGQTAGAGLGATAVTGTITLQLGSSWTYGYNGTTTPGIYTVQWMLDELPIGPQLTASNQSPDPYHCPPFALSFDTTTVPDGTHMIWLKFLDHTSDQVYNYQAFAKPLVVHNSGFISGPQKVPSTTGNQLRGVLPNRPDYVQYPGGGGTPQNTAQPWPYAFVAPAGGVPPSAPPGAFSPYFLESTNNPTTQEYHTDPVWSTLSPLETGSTDGGVWIQPVSVELSGSIQGTGISQTGYTQSIALNPSDGGRCVNFLGALVNLIEVPDGSGWYGVELQGRLYKQDHTGDITTIAGFTKDFTKLSYNVGLGYDPNNEDLLRTRQIKVGNFTPSDLNLGTAIDACVDPRNANIIYVCKQGDSCILKVDMTGFPRTPATVTVFAGTDGTPGYGGDGGLCNAAGVFFDNCNSIIMTDGVHGPDPAGVMYVADTNNCVIRKIASPSAGVPGTITTFLGYQPARPTRAAFESNPTFYSPETGTLAFSTFAGPTPRSFIPYPFTIRLTSNGDIVILQNENVQCRRINLTAQTVTHIGYFGGSLAVVNDSWAWMAVDTAGAIGAVDDIIIAQVLSITGGAENFWRLPITGGAGGEVGGAFGVNGLPRSSAEDVYFYEGWGHYPWAAAISTHEGRAIFNGVSDRGLHVIKIASTNDPMIGDPGTFNNGRAPNLDLNASSAGDYIWKTGTVAGRGAGSNGWPSTGISNAPPGYPRPFPFNSRPSFTSVHGNTGNGLLGIPGASSFDEMIKTYPSDAALAAYIQSGMGGSTPRPEITGNDMRDLIYFIRLNTIAGYTDNSGNAVQPGADHPDTGNFPTITSISAVRNSSTSITVTWYTDKPTIGFAACGTAAQQAFTVNYPVFSPIESRFGTTHTATITQCPIGATPLHYTAVAKDAAGNSVYAGDQVII